MSEDDLVTFQTEDGELAICILNMFLERGFIRIPFRCIPAPLQYATQTIDGVYHFKWCDGPPATPDKVWKDLAKRRNEELRTLAEEYGNPLPFDRDQLARMLEERGIDVNPAYMSKYLKSAGRLKCIDRRTKQPYLLPLPDMPYEQDSEYDEC